MAPTKLHHYVPQFYLRRFVDSTGRLWLWDRKRDRSFGTHPANVAAENRFYYLDEFVEHGHDPLTMEKQLSHLEGEVSLITDQWLDWLRLAKGNDKIPVPAINRELVALYVALQWLRTAEARDITATVAKNAWKREPSEKEKRLLHTDMLWDERLIRPTAERVKKAIWVFGRNATSTPFITSDNPIAFRTGDNSQWSKIWFGVPAMYIVFPLAPDIVMYCYPRDGRWKKLARFDRSLSPVTFTDGMAQSENTGQAFLASRFVISPRNDFEQEREFIKSIRYVDFDQMSRCAE